MLSLVLVLVCLCIFWVFLRGPEGPKVLMQPGGWPIIGNIFDFASKDGIQLWESISKYTYYNLKNGGVSQANFGPVRVYIVTDPDDCHTVSNICLQKPYIYKFATLLKNGLALVDPPLWKSHRKLFNRAFNPENLNIYMDIFNEQCKILCENIAAEVGQGMFDPHSYITNYAFTTACRTTFGSNSDEYNKICKIFIDVVERAFDIYIKRFGNFWLHVPLLYNLSSLKRESDELIKIATDITGSIIATRKLELKEVKEFGKDNNPSNGKFTSLLDLLLNVEEEEAITDTEIRERIDTIIIGNYDTSSTSLLITLAFIGSHPDVQQKIYEELKNVFDDQQCDFNRQDISKLVYLEAVIKESLRVYPVVPVIAREATTEVKLKDYTIPAGGFYLLSIYGMHRHEMWGADAEQFRPERWLEPGGVPDNANIYSPFSMGKRNCIGKAYAMLSLKITLAHLLLRYHITADVSKIKFKWNTFLKPVSGHEIAIELRT